MGERLKGLRPIPIVAMTATATPVVQSDICTQLGLVKEARFIEGFRRTNIAIEAAELPPAERGSAILSILKKPGRLPAIVYAPTRKKAEEIQAQIASNFAAGSYHAGITAAVRERIQTQFQEGKLEVIVATVAFGMGIDKANVRTVIHAAMPGSVEGFYQEIGRAGRDGLPSKAFLLHSYVDQKTHDFFREMNYPAIEELKKIFAELSQQPKSKDVVRENLLKMDSDTFEKALEQLWVHGGVIIDPEENMILGNPSWVRTYLAQSEQSRQQVQKMRAFVSLTKCRMVSLVSHFGDLKDSGTNCGICDICKPGEHESLVKRHPLSPEELRHAELIVSSLRRDHNQAYGRLFQELSADGVPMSRGIFEELIAALGRAGWVDLTQESFEKDGRTIHYRKMSLTQSGRRSPFSELATLEMATSKFPGSSNQKKPRAKKATVASPSGRKSREPVKSSLHGVESLRAWRLEQARKRGVPAFRILTDKALLAICERNPRNKSEILGVSGVSRKAADQYGDDILRVLKNISEKRSAHGQPSILEK